MENECSKGDESLFATWLRGPLPPTNACDHFVKTDETAVLTKEPNVGNTNSETTIYGNQFQMKNEKNHCTETAHEQLFPQPLRKFRDFNTVHISALSSSIPQTVKKSSQCKQPKGC